MSAAGLDQTTVNAAVDAAGDSGVPWQVFPALIAAEIPGYKSAISGLFDFRAMRDPALV